MTSPVVPGRPNHSRAAMTTASPSSVKASPSRRCAGSSSRAPWPIRRAVPPIRWAPPIQIPRTTRTGKARLRAPARPLRARPRAPPPAPRLPVRARVAEAGRPGEDVRVAMIMHGTGGRTARAGPERVCLRERDRPAPRALCLDDHRDDHRTPLEPSRRPAAHHPAHHLLELVRVRGTTARRLLESVLDPVSYTHLRAHETRHD